MDIADTIAGRSPKEVCTDDKLTAQILNDRETPHILQEPKHEYYELCWTAISAHIALVARKAALGFGIPHEAEEIAQNARERILKSLPKFEGRSKLTTWVYSVVKNAAREHLRFLSGKETSDLCVEDWEEENIDSTTNNEPQHSMEAEEDSAELKALLEKFFMLKPSKEQQNRQIVTLLLAEVNKHRIAEQVGVSTRTVERVIAELRKFCRQHNKFPNVVSKVAHTLTLSERTQK